MAACPSHGPLRRGGFVLLLASLLSQNRALREAVSVQEVNNSFTDTVGKIEDALGIDSDGPDTSNVTNMTFQGYPGEAPGVRLTEFDSEGTWAHANYDGKMMAQMKDRTDGDHSWVRVTQIDGQDVTGESYAQILNTWADLVKRERSYSVVVDWHEALKYGEGELIFPLMKPVLIAGIVPAFLAGLFSCCLMPCFLCRQCRMCGWSSILTAAPDGPEDQDLKNATSVAPRLDRSLLLVRVTDSQLLRATLGVFAATVAVRAACVGSRERVFRGRPLFLAAFLVFTFGWLSQTGVVIWGLETAKHVTFMAKGIECYVDHEDLTGELRSLAWAFVPKLLVTCLLGMCLVCGISWTVCEIGSEFLWGGGGVPLHAALQYAAMLAVPCITLACECVLTVMTCRFILEAFLVARTAKHIVKTMQAELSKPPGYSIDPVHLKRIHVACGHLANHVLPELAKISKPTLGLVALKTAFASSSVVPVVFILARAEGSSSEIAFRCYFVICFMVYFILSDILLGLWCLLLPASVSDACTDLVMAWNDLRVQPFKEGCEAEVERQIRLTELFLKESNRGQGLGFVLDGFGTVIDKRMIVSIFTKFLALSSIILTVLRKVYEEPQAEMEAERLLERVK